VLIKQSTFTIENITAFKTKMLNWANQFNIFCMLDNHQYNFNAPVFDCLLAVGCKKHVTAQAGHAFNVLKAFAQQNKQWLFGHVGYDIKNEIEKLKSIHFDGIQLPDMYFFEPEIVLQISKNKVQIFADTDAAIIFETINNFITKGNTKKHTIPIINSRFSKAAYIKAVQQIQHHIAKGDCYEVNFCQEFYAEQVQINAIDTYFKLAALSPNPFSALYKLNHTFCICASPERYFKKTGNTIMVQPIKGTSKRVTNNAVLDEENKLYLTTSEKEKSENVMVVDLVRNDLSKICKEGSVKVKELFGVYSFPQVHQMISTVTGQISNEQNWVDVLQASFPMASMTGAPKKRVMQLIEQYELTKRGLFSGTIGYVQPNGNADFNVVIRSILYNEQKKYLSFQTGSAITFYSNPQHEYNECLLKASAIKQVLLQNS
jgi:para-aminobenzoate synthetase component I